VPTATAGGDRGLGRIRIYELDSRSGIWTQQSSDDNNLVGIQGGGIVNDAVLSLLGNVLAYTDVDNIVWVFQWDGKEWAPLGQQLPVTTADDEWGVSLDLFQTIYDGGALVLAIGFAERSSHGNAVGNVLVFEYEEANLRWVQRGSTIQGARPYNMAGRVYLSEGYGDGSVLAVTSPAERQLTGAPASRVQMFRFQDGEWSQWGPDIRDDVPYFGVKCSLSGDLGDPFGVGRVILAAASLESVKVFEAIPDSD